MNEQLNTVTNKPLVMRLNKKGQLELDCRRKGQKYFRVSCGCMRCNEIWLGLAMGAIVVEDQKGNRVVPVQMATKGDIAYDKKVRKNLTKKGE